MSDRVSLCSGSASELSRSISDASILDPEKKRANGWLLSGDPPTAFSVPIRGSGRVGALQPKLHDEQRAQTVTGLAFPACVSRIWRKYPAGSARACAGSAVSLREVQGFSHVRNEWEPVNLRQSAFFRVTVSFVFLATV